jgi:hypothetical protein
MNVCPVRVVVERGDTFLTLFRQVEREVWDAARHQGCAMRFVAGAQPYDVLVNVPKAAVTARTFGDLAMEVAWLAPTHRFGALAVAVQDFSATDNLTLDLDFNEATFGRASREDISRRLLRMLEEYLANPERGVEEGRGVPVAPPGQAVSLGPAAERPTSLPPRTKVEREVAAIWCALLGVRAVGLEDDFFALGGDSLLAYRMLARVGAALRVESAAERFFSSPTVASVVAAIASAHSGGGSATEIEPTLQALAALSDEAAEALLGEAERSGGCGAGDLDG